MAIKIRKTRKQTYTMETYLKRVQDGEIENDADTQRYPAYKSIIDGLAVTSLTGDYISPIILAEENNSQKHIVDGGSRTAALRLIRYGNYKVKSSVENPIIPYKKKVKDENDDITWEDAEFDIRNKTYEQFPEELKNIFNEYQIETVIHENCDSNDIAMYMKRYNQHTAMNANQKMFLYLPKYARKARKITNRTFFVNNNVINDIEKEKGILERIVMESIMCMFHFDDWNKQGKKIATYLNEKSSEEEFNQLNNNLERLEKVITDETKILFNSKNCFVWLTLFERFKKIGIEDSKFGEFLEAFIDELKYKEVDGKLFDKVDETGSTKDKRIIEEKLHILETLMYDFLHINKEEIQEVDILDFVKENVSECLEEEDIELYEDCLDSLTVEMDQDEKLLDSQNKPSLLAMVAYACEIEKDFYIEEWFKEFVGKNKSYILNQKENYLLMKENFDGYVNRLEVA